MLIMRAFANESAESHDEMPDAQTAAANRSSAAPAASAPRDEARLLVQSPTKLFFYWSLARDPLPALRAALGDAAAKFGPAVRLVEVSGDGEGEPAAVGDDENSCWLDALPGHSYRAELGFHAAGLSFVRVLSSNAAETPAAGVSPDSDAAPEFEIGEREFARVLEVSGYEHARRRASPSTLAARTCAPDAPELPTSSSPAAGPTLRPDVF